MPAPDPLQPPRPVDGRAPDRDEEDDDRPVGRILKRREVLLLLGGAGAALTAVGAAEAASFPFGRGRHAPGVQPPGQGVGPGGARPGPAGNGGYRAPGRPLATPVATGTVVALPGCVVRPELTEGPYFVDEKLNRSDVRADSASGPARAGVRLDLAFNVSHVVGGACVPLAGATVDVWQCDALGVYSDVSDRSFNTRGQNFLRGYQTTDTNGLAAFTTIYPGWYQGRATHIHFKIRGAVSTGATYEFTSQLFFDDALNDQVYATQAPYTSKGTGGRTRNAQDGIYRSGGSQLLLAPTQTADGYGATFPIALQVP